MSDGIFWNALSYKNDLKLNGFVLCAPLTLFLLQFSSFLSILNNDDELIFENQAKQSQSFKADSPVDCR